MALGGPSKYTGRTIKAAHQHLNITESDWGVFCGHFVNCLKEAGVAQEDIDTIVGIVGGLHDDVVKPANQPPTLYEKYGGEGTVENITSKFVDIVKDDGQLGHHFKGVDDRGGFV